MNVDAEWFVATEAKYGGFVSGLPRRVFSPQEVTPDPDYPVYMIGGDRMSPDRHNYAHIYARYLRRLIDRRLEPLTILEIGVLRGTGLAIWSDLFPKATLIGLDIDLGYFRDNLPRLQAAGAFPERLPEIYNFDQLVDGRDRMGAIIGARKLDLVIDDGCHKDAAIIQTYEAVRDFLHPDAVYIAEDNWTVAGHLSTRASDRSTIAAGKVTVVKKRCECW